MEEDIYLDKLDRRGIKPTAIRLLVIKAMMQAERAVSLLDLETLLDTVDKSTISRTIALFLSHHLIHSIDDGSGSLGDNSSIKKIDKMGKVPKLKLQVLKVRNIVIILSKLVNGIKLRIEVYKISVIFEKYIRNKLLLVHSLYYAK